MIVLGVGIERLSALLTNNRTQREEFYTQIYSN